MTIAPADFATPLCIAGEREGSVEDEERESARERGRKWKEDEMDRERGGKEEKKTEREREKEWEGRRGANAEC